MNDSLWHAGAIEGFIAALQVGGPSRSSPRSQSPRRVIVTHSLAYTSPSRSGTGAAVVGQMSDPLSLCAALCRVSQLMQSYGLSIEEYTGRGDLLTTKEGPKAFLAVVEDKSAEALALLGTSAHV